MSWPIIVLRQRYHITANTQANGLMENLILKTRMEMALAMAVFKTTARCTHVTKVPLRALHWQSATSPTLRMLPRTTLLFFLSYTTPHGSVSPFMTFLQNFQRAQLEAALVRGSGSLMDAARQICTWPAINALSLEPPLPLLWVLLSHQCTVVQEALLNVKRALSR